MQPVCQSTTSSRVAIFSSQVFRTIHSLDCRIGKNSGTISRNRTTLVRTSVTSSRHSWCRITKSRSEEVLFEIVYVQVVTDYLLDSIQYYCEVQAVDISKVEVRFFCT